MKKEKENKLVQILKNKKGYLKKGSLWLSNNFNVSEEEAYNALVQVRNELNKPTIKVEHIIKNADLVYKNANNQISQPGTYWVTGCAHAPWQNRAMYNSTIKYLDENVKLSGIILAGDIIDANSLSFHDRGNIALPGVTLDWEYREANKFLDQIDSLGLANNTYFLYGNHEDRYNRLTKNVDANKYGKALKSPTEGLKLHERGYAVFTDWKNDRIKIGKYLDVNHGEFFNVHSAKKTIDTYRKSTLYFHTHRFQIYMEGQVAGFNMGFGANINAPIFGFASRAMKNSWNNASALVTLDKDGYYHVQPMLFMNNKLVINGKEY